MSFKRHREIYPSDEDASLTGAPAHRLDEFPVGYSLVGCAPAGARLRFANRFRVCAKVVLPVDYFSSNGQQCLNCLSHPRGQVHAVLTIAASHHPKNFLHLARCHSECAGATLAGS